MADKPETKFTKDDLKAVVGFGGYVRPNQITPERVQALDQEWHQSKIVKFGSLFLLVVWLTVLSAISYAYLKVLGLITLAAVLVAIVISYKTYRKTKSPLAWYIFVTLVGLAAATMFLLEHTK